MGESRTNHKFHEKLQDFANRGVNVTFNHWLYFTNSTKA